MFDKIKKDIYSDRYKIIEESKNYKIDKFIKVGVNVLLGLPSLVVVIMNISRDLPFSTLVIVTIFYLGLFWIATYILELKTLVMKFKECRFREELRNDRLYKDLDDFNREDFKKKFFVNKDYFLKDLADKNKLGDILRYGELLEDLELGDF